MERNIQTPFFKPMDLLGSININALHLIRTISRKDLLEGYGQTIHMFTVKVKLPKYSRKYKVINALLKHGCGDAVISKGRDSLLHVDFWRPYNGQVEKIKVVDGAVYNVLEALPNSKLIQVMEF